LIRYFKLLKFFLKNEKRRTYTFSYPKENKLVVFDAKNIEIINKILIHDLDYTIITKREGIFFVNIGIIAKTIINKLFYKCGFEIAYYICLLEIIKPKVIITFFSRNKLGLLSKYYKAEYFSIQNGYHTLDHKLTHYTPNLYCFGDYDKFLYERSGIKIKNYFPVGSIKASYYKQNLSKNIKIKYDICLISQYRSEIEEPNGCQGIQEYNLLQQFILKYINNNSVNFVIAMNNHQPEKERLYYEKIFDGKATLIENKMEEFTTYFTMDQSEIVVSMNSTASFEALGWGKKSFIFSLTGDLDFSLNRKFSNYLFMHNNAYIEFEKIISFLIKVDQNKYNTLLKKDRTYFMNYNPKFPAHKFIRDKIISNIHNNEVNN